MEKKQRKGVIYKITFPNGKVYIGKTVVDINKRLQKHISSANIKTSREYNTKMSRAIRKYGSDFLKIEVLVADINEGDLDKEEIKLIAEFNSKKKGYNSTIGGSGALGYKHSELVKKKMALIKKNQKEINPNFIARGEKSGQAKTNWKNVIEIRRIYKEEDASQSFLAKKFKLSRRAIGAILTNKTWRDSDYNGDIGNFKKGIKLSKNNVDEIRLLFLTGKYSIKDLGKTFNISFQYVYGIITNKHFKDEEFENKMDTIKDIIKYNKGKCGRLKRLLSDEERVNIINLFISGKSAREICEIIKKKVSISVIWKLIAKTKQQQMVKVPK